MKPYRYAVETVCTAVIRETWTIRSALPLTPADVAALLDLAAHIGGLDTGTVHVAPCEDAMRVEEGPRAIVHVATVAAPAPQ